MTRYDTRRLIVFARAPQPGRVKTRLVPALGAAAAADLYGKLLDNTLTEATRVLQVSVELWCDGRDGDTDGCDLLASRFHIPLRRQQGPDLGSRMLHALGTSLHTARDAVLVGSDCPDMDAGYLSRAFAALDEHDAVLGPAADGGYVLIGMRQAQPRIFRDMPWGTGRVLDLTRSRMAELGWHWMELPPLRDLDRPSDLAQFPQFSGWSPNGTRDH